MAKGSIFGQNPQTKDYKSASSFKMKNDIEPEKFRNLDERVVINVSTIWPRNLFLPFLPSNDRYYNIIPHPLPNLLLK